MVVDFDPVVVGSIVGPMSIGFAVVIRGIKRLQAVVQSLPCHPITGTITDDVASEVLARIPVTALARCPSETPPGAGKSTPFSA